MNKIILGMDKKVRYESDNGLLSIEDLLHIDLETLDKILVDLDNERGNTKSYIKMYMNESNDNEEDELQLKFDIAKAIFEYRIEKIRKEKEMEKIKQQKEFISKILYEKQMEKIKSLDEDTLEKLYKGELTLDDIK